MKITKSFVFDTPISDWKGKILGYCRVSGKGYLHTQSFEAHESDNDTDALFSFDVESVILQSGTDITEAYRLDVLLRGDIADIVDKATQAHMEYLFTDEVGEHYGRMPQAKCSYPELDYTDTVQDEN